MPVRERRNAVCIPLPERLNAEVAPSEWGLHLHPEAPSMPRLPRLDFSRKRRRAITESHVPVGHLLRREEPGVGTVISLDFEKAWANIPLRQPSDASYLSDGSAHCSKSSDSDGTIDGASVDDDVAYAADGAGLDFDSHAHGPAGLIALVEKTLVESDLMKTFHIEPPTLHRFLERVRNQYRAENPYHNFHHAVDVFQACSYLLANTAAAQLLSPLDRFSLLIATIVHDLDHPGTNNNFQVLTASELALVYNDHSVLENHHAATAFRTLLDPACDILAGLTVTERREARRVIIALVLGTDMASHSAHVTSFQTLLRGGDSSSVIGEEPDPDQRLALMSILIKMSDISNVARSFSIAVKTSALVQDEFYMQGDLEKSKGHTPAKLFDRTQVAASPWSNTLGFLRFLAEPFFEVCAESPLLQPAAGAMLANLKANRSQLEQAEKAYS